MMENTLLCLILQAGTALCGFEDTITCGKQATVLKGVGKGSAGWIVSFPEDNGYNTLETSPAGILVI